MEVFGAIRAAVAQTSDAAVMTGSMMKQRAVLVDHGVRRDRRRELHQVHVLLCVVARRHVAAAESMAATRLAARAARSVGILCPAERSPSGAAIFGG